MVPKFGQILSITRASALYSSLGGSNFCQIGTNCLKNKKCSCVALGKLCSNKCHKKEKMKRVLNAMIVNFMDKSYVVK
jgi:hypothetical protein